MRTRFADTSFFVAHFNSRDEHHAWSVNYLENTSDRIVTTNLVLVELGNILSRSRARNTIPPFISDLKADPRVEIIHADVRMFEEGLNIYASRPDKEWGLTDCVSFVVMRRQGIAEALTADHHFEQAGFLILPT